VKSYPVQLHPSLKCWRRTRKKYQDTELLESEYLRCTPRWRGGESRKDYCWVQEFPLTDSRDENPLPNPLNGRRIGQLQALVTVVDIRCRLKDREEHPTYYCVLIDTMPIKNQGQPHEIHGMVEVGPALVSHPRSNRGFFGRQFYPLNTILRSAHIVPAFIGTKSKGTDIYYINNYIDWDQYQDLFEIGWMEKQTRRALAIYKRLEQAKMAEKARQKKEAQEEEEEKEIDIGEEDNKEDEEGEEEEDEEEEEEEEEDEGVVQNKKRKRLLSNAKTGCCDKF